MSEQPSEEQTLVMTTEAAARLGVTERYVRRLLTDGRLVGQRVGRRWMVDASSLPTHERPIIGSSAESPSWAIERDLLYAERADLQRVVADERIARLEERLASTERERDALRSELEAVRSALVVIVSGRRASAG